MTQQVSIVLDGEELNYLLIVLDNEIDGELNFSSNGLDEVQAKRTVELAELRGRLYEAQFHME